jgi:predicted transcriptional regulator
VNMWFRMRKVPRIFPSVSRDHGASATKKAAKSRAVMIRADVAGHKIICLKPHFAEAILAGQKTFEFRRAVFRENVRTVVLYASSPTRKAVGEFTIDEVLSQRLDALWETTHKGGAIDREYFDQYFEGRTAGYALKVKRARRYRAPLCLFKHFGISHPPQSFRYLRRREKECQPKSCPDK